jgi:Tfp pilus assembly protein PilF
VRVLPLVLLATNGCAIVVPVPSQEANAVCAQHLLAGHLDEADAACDLALEYQPKYWDALHNKGLIAQARGDKTRAKKLFIEALRANNHMASTLNVLGALALEEGDFTAAEEHFRRALVVDPTYREPRRNLGVTHLKLQQWGEAAKDFRQLVMIDPQLVEGHLGLGSALMAEQKYDEAASSLERATTLDVGDALAWSMRAECALARGRKAEAKDAWERCLLADEKKLECQRGLEALME